MVFNFSTFGKKDIKLSFAAINELTNATGILVDYSLNAGDPTWTTDGLASSTLPLTNAYQLFNIDFSNITAANNNANFKVRLRFTGANMTADTGARISFNNIAVHGTQLSLAVEENSKQLFAIYPKPVREFLNVVGLYQTGPVNFKLFSIDGKQIKSGSIDNSLLNLSDLSRGLYLLEMESEGKIEIEKIIKE